MLTTGNSNRRMPSEVRLNYFLLSNFSENFGQYSTKRGGCQGQVSQSEKEGKEGTPSQMSLFSRCLFL